MPKMTYSPTRNCYRHLTDGVPIPNGFQPFNGPVPVGAKLGVWPGDYRPPAQPRATRPAKPAAVASAASNGRARPARPLPFPASRKPVAAKPKPAVTYNAAEQAIMAEPVPDDAIERAGYMARLAWAGMSGSARSGWINETAFVGYHKSDARNRARRGDPPRNPFRP